MLDVNLKQTSVYFFFNNGLLFNDTELLVLVQIVLTKQREFFILLKFAQGFAWWN